MSATTVTADEFGVYFSCKGGQVTAKDYPVYGSLRQASGADDVAGRIGEAVTAWLKGPTPQERSEGYFAANPAASNPEVTADVTLRGGTAQVNFSTSLAERGLPATSAAARQVISELSATILQFEQAERAELTVAGDCERFWDLFIFDFESCPTLEVGTDPLSPRQ